MAGEIQLNSTTMATESSGSITLSNVDSATNRTNLGLGSIATQNVDGFPGRNRLINGSFQIAQRGTTFSGGTDNADDTYTLDRWYVLSEGNDSIDVAQQSDSPDSNGKSIGLDVETTGEKFGIAQIIEGHNCIGAIGNTCTLSFYAKVSNARIDTVKAAIVAWSGTEDTVTSDIISAWNADGTTPTLIANATFENTPADLSVTTSWARYELSANVDTASTKNIIVFIWSDDASNPQAGDFLYLTNIQFESETSVATPFEHRPNGLELSLCQKYFEKSYNLDVAPGTSTQEGSFRTIAPRSLSGATDYMYSVQYKVTKRAGTDLIIYSTDGTQGSVRDLSGAANTTLRVSLGAASNLMTSFDIQDTRFYAFQWTANAEL